MTLPSWRVPIAPHAAPRLSMRDRYPKIATERAKRYFAWRDEYRLRLGSRIPALLSSPALGMEFGFKRTQAVSHVAEGAAKISAPDLDNLVKAVLDAIFLKKSDAGIWKIEARKVWAAEPYVAVRPIQ